MSTKYLVFSNPGLLSLIDLTTMGDSCKREDSTKIGQFDSGLKYALAILIRNNIAITICSGSKEFTFSTDVISDETTCKTKEVILIKEFDFYDGDEINTDYKTAFSPKLGYDWNFWMAFREIYSNCLDEGGSYAITEDLMEHANYATDNEATTIIITITDKVQEVLNNWDKYFNTKDPITESYGYKIYENDSDYLKIYKNNILVYKDEDKKALYSYGYDNAELDEKRILNNSWRIVDNLDYPLYKATDKDFIKDFLSKNNAKVIEGQLDISASLSTEFEEVLNKLNGEYYSSTSLKRKIANSSNIKSNLESVHANMSNSYFSTPKLVETSTDIQPSFEEKIKKEIESFNLGIEVSVVLSKNNDAFKVLCSIYKSTLFVQDSYDFIEHKWQLLKACLRIKSEDREDELFKYLTQRF